jgi:hypothetical protein
VGHTETHRRNGDVVALLFSLGKENRLKGENGSVETEFKFSTRAKVTFFVCNNLARCFQNLRSTIELLSAVLKLLQTKSIVAASCRDHISLYGPCLKFFLEFIR